MDIVSASNIGMTNATKNKINKNKMYVLVHVWQMSDFTVGHNTYTVSICNYNGLVKLALNYYAEHRLKCVKEYKDLDLQVPENAIKILTQRKYLKIEEIDEDAIGKTLMQDNPIQIVSIDNF